jgi:hypothetical protein
MKLINNNWLFLDDIRIPSEAFLYTKNPIYIKHWDIVRTYDQFVEYITEKGMPSIISFDHDLADEHYVGLAEGKLDGYTEKTGYECVKWLVDYCLDNEVECPNFLVHSMNPVGKEKIEGLLNNFKRNFRK